MQKRTNRGGKPFHSFLVRGVVRKNVAGTAEGEHPVPLQLAPDLYTLTGTPGWKAEDEQQPGNFF